MTNWSCSQSFGVTTLPTEMVFVTFGLVVLGTPVAINLMFLYAANFTETVLQGMHLYTPHIPEPEKPRCPECFNHAWNRPFQKLRNAGGALHPTTYPNQWGCLSRSLRMLLSRMPYLHLLFLYLLMTYLLQSPIIFTFCRWYHSSLPSFLLKCTSSHYQHRSWSYWYECITCFRPQGKLCSGICKLWLFHSKVSLALPSWISIRHHFIQLNHFH